MRCIARKFGFGLDVASVARADKAMLCIEARDLLPRNSWWDKWRGYLSGTEPSIDSPLFSYGQEPMPAPFVERIFLELFAQFARTPRKSL